jgi:hypothetical protein
VQGNGKDTPTAPAACIDAETLAAWADGGLPEAEAATVEMHLAGCDRCTAMLATFARTIPAAPATESLWKRWHLRWLVPVATAATVASLYVLIPRQQPAEVATFSSAPPTRETQADPAAQEPPSPLTAARSVQAPEVREQDAVRKREDSRLQRQQVAVQDRADANANAAQQPPSLNESVTLAQPTPREFERAENKLADRQSERLATTVTGETPAASPAAAAAPAAPASPPAQAAARAPTATPPPPAATSAFSSDTGARARTLGSTASVTTVFEVVSSSNPMTRWRVTGAGQVERSTNGGGQWERATLPESATLTGGSSPSPSVCWLAGRSGAIYVTTDGLRFTRVNFRERTDFVSIQATDARRATVVTTDGRTMRTEDQGATWIRVTP